MARSAVVCDADVLSLDHFPIPFATVGADGAIHAANRLFHLMLGYQPGGLIGRAVNEVAAWQTRYEARVPSPWSPITACAARRPLTNAPWIDDVSR